MGRPEKPNLVRDRSFAFAVRIVKVARALRDGQREYSLAGQVLRSGTSIGANIEEALSAETRADFVHKLAVAAKETRETGYWLRLLVASEVVAVDLVEPLAAECGELLAIINSIILTTRRNADASGMKPRNTAGTLPLCKEEDHHYPEFAIQSSGPVTLKPESGIQDSQIEPTVSEFRIQNSEFEEE